MRFETLPKIGFRYWIALSVASICGANLGDFVAKGLGISAVQGLAVLALLFVAVAAIGRRSKGRSDAPYWLAILIVRSAATNLADLAVEHAGLGYAACSAGLAMTLVVVLLWRRTHQQVQPAGSQTRLDGSYWIAMLTAGALGTVLGDYLGHMIHPPTVGYPSAALIAGFAAVLISVLWPPRWAALTTNYWVLVVAIRTWGTDVGDIFAYLLSLPVSTLLTGLVLTGVLALWQKPHDSSMPVPA